MNHDWNEALAPLFERYGDAEHPLRFENRWQLLVVVLLAAQDSDAKINKLAPAFFAAYPDPQTAGEAEPEAVAEAIANVRSCRKKARWIVEIARAVGTEAGIPRTLEALVKLPGVGRKTANVIIRESRDPAAGVAVDLHVARVAKRLGIATKDKADAIEQELMAALPRERWNDAGIALTLLGRTLCRPTAPDCVRCPVLAACAHGQERAG